MGNIVYVGIDTGGFGTELFDVHTQHFTVLFNEFNDSGMKIRRMLSKKPFNSSSIFCFDYDYASYEFTIRNLI